MFSFDGQFKTRRVVSLGGASKKEQRTSLIQRTQAERQKREELRRQNASALKIQSFLRAEHVRHQQYDLQRQSFDETIHAIEKTKSIVASSSDVRNLLRSLLFFYSHSKDTERLIWMCQFLLKNRNIVLQLQIEDHTSWLHQIKCLLLICSRSLESSLNDSKPVAIQLRMLEVFTSHDSFYNPADPTGNRKDAAMVTVHLTRNGYFRYLRALLNARVPSSLEQSSVPPTPLAAAIRDLVMSPLQLSTQMSMEGENMLHVNQRHEVLLALISDILCPEMTEQITCFLLPSLAEPSAQFPFDCLLDTLLMLLRGGSSGDSNGRLTPSPWLLFGVLAFVDKHLGPSSDLVVLKTYIQVLQILLMQLPHPVSVNSDGEDSDSDSEMETDSLQAGPALEKLKEKCLDVIDSKEHVKTLESLLMRPQMIPESEVITALCNICHFLMSESRLPIHKTRVLYTLALNPVFVRELWRNVQFVTVFTNTGKQIALIDLISRGTNLSTQEAELITPLLSLLSSLLSNALFSVHDNEFYGEEGQRNSFLPFSLSEMERMSSVLCNVAIGIIQIIYPETSPTFTGQYLAAMKSVGAKSAMLQKDEFYPKQKWIKLLKDVTSLVRQLHSRDSRRQFCAEGHWLSHKVGIDPTQMRIDGFLNQEDTADGVIEAGMSSTTSRNMAILKHVPFVVRFKDRVKLLQRIIAKNRVDSQGELHNFMMGPAIDVTVNRNYIYRDAFDQLTEDKAPNLRQKLRVRMINAQGLEEAGVDGGGIFREFLSQLLKAGFDPNIGFFKSTHERLLYPNPQAGILANDYLKHYHFLGRMLGKALYENMMVELPFASFFLCKLLSKHGTDVDIHHLESLDPEMYRNLLFLKNYRGNVEELSLNFTVVNNDLGESQVVELKPGGRDIPVTNSNRISYIHLVADYRLNKQIHRHCQAFRTGLSDVINLDWLRMFDHNELQVLVSGALIPVDLDDLRRNTNYSGGFTQDHPCVLSFWRVVNHFTDTQKRQLLKFVTSCSRPPLLGFKELEPPFCVHSAGPEDRLPTASTCMNLLKLPEYLDDATMREKLLYAVESGAGFELS
ncbi:ubiquitin-protein ligase E3C-like [Montipora capricornis]|uniref:ubiquitin-protein ligase E3C-like n=1 Tax=Montipora capricornis TaxID=246305 RepID=UPI0035F201A9